MSGGLIPEDLPRLGIDELLHSRLDQRIRELGGWRGQTLARMRALILEANPPFEQPMA